ncbi:MAG: hypothetical protein LBJ83_03535 [Oscillospiraceae bacterium]|jgi:hypothetical protein|nr:hypothetical protein [Oscillospiraceae bacterium]
MLKNIFAAKAGLDSKNLAFFFALVDVLVFLVLVLVKKFAIISFVSVVLGSFCSFLNIVFLSMAIDKSVNMPQLLARSYIRSNYIKRFLGLGFVCALVIKSGFLNFGVFFLPMFIPQYFFIFSQIIARQRG